MTIMFHEGNRQLQDQFDSRRIADRLEEKLTRQAFTEGDRSLIEALPHANGAAYLAADAAMRSGAGLVTVATPASSMSVAPWPPRTASCSPGGPIGATCASGCSPAC